MVWEAGPVESGNDIWRLDLGPPVRIAQAGFFVH
jgi:hypothetical protein